MISPRKKGYRLTIQFKKPCVYHAYMKAPQRERLKKRDDRQTDRETERERKFYLITSVKLRYELTGAMDSTLTTPPF